MLRFTQKLELSFQKKQRFFSYDFCKALLCAALFHGALILTFRITSLPSFDHMKPLTPTDVEIDVNTATSVFLPSPLHILFPLSTSEPTLNTQPITEIPPLPFKRKFHYQEPDFTELETIPYLPLEEIL